MCNLNAKGNSPLAKNQTLFEEVHECCAAAKLLLTTQANTKPLAQYKNIAFCWEKKSFQANDKCPPLEGKSREKGINYFTRGTRLCHNKELV